MTLLAIGEGDDASALINHAQNAGPRTQFTCSGSHKHRNLLAHAPERLQEEITADYNDMIYAATCEEIEARRRAFIRKWRLKHRAIADSLEKAGDRLFSFTRLPPSQWKSNRTTNAIEWLHEEFKRRRTPRPCCSGLCSPRDKSTCARSMAGKRSPQNPLVS